MFITFEGIEGSGKSSQAKLLSEYLKQNGIDSVLTKEPGELTVPVCKDIREMLLNPKNEICPKAELFLFLADRAQHINDFVIPNLNNGKWVICDRFTDSTIAYQGARNNIVMKEAIASIHYAAPFSPDLTFIMDLPVEVGLSRAKVSNEEFVGGDRMEAEHISFHSKVREGFLNLSKSGDQYVIIDASGSISDIHNSIKQVIKERSKV